jgi:hypothetical protein
MAKRASGPPRRPRNPMARAVRTPLYRQRVVPDKRWQERVKEKPEEENGAAEDEKPEEPQAPGN